MEFSLPLVIGAGVLSFLSPCVLPLVPPYLTYMSGASYDQLRAEAVSGSPGRLTGRVALTSIFFILGFSVVFIALGATATAFGQVFRQLLPILTPIAGVVIIAMGLHFLGVFRIGILDRQLRHNGPGAASGPLGGFLLGLAFAIGWTPCIGPVLAAILAVAGSTDTVARGAGLLAIYSLGLGIPFLLVAFFAEHLVEALGRFRRHLPKVEKAMGAFLVLAGLMFLTGQMSRPWSMRRRMSLPASRVSSMRRSASTSVRFSTSGRSVWRRENASSWRTSEAARLAFCLMFMMSAKEGSDGRWLASSRSDAMMMAVSTLLKSCAMPPASWPTACIFCPCAICASSAFCSVVSTA